jgi:hypothetical protein
MTFATWVQTLTDASKHAFLIDSISVVRHYTFQWITPIVNWPPDVTIPHLWLPTRSGQSPVSNQPASHLSYPLYMDWPVCIVQRAMDILITTPLYVDWPGRFNIVPIVDRLAGPITTPSSMDRLDLYCTHCRPTGWMDNNPIVHGLARPVLYPL